MQEQRREPGAAAGAGNRSSSGSGSAGAFLNGDIISNAVNGNDQVFMESPPYFKVDDYSVILPCFLARRTVRLLASISRA